MIKIIAESYEHPEAVILRYNQEVATYDEATKRADELFKLGWNYVTLEFPDGTIEEI